jgi:DHA1 family inner membrane transport protein
VASIVGIVAPLLGGWALATQVAFSAVATVQMIAFLPLLGAPNVAVARKAKIDFAAWKPCFFHYLANGWIVAGSVFTSQIALFLWLGESLAAYGRAIALVALAGALSGLLLGRWIDGGKSVSAAWLSFAAWP